jgi:hypothetical protein
MCLGGCHSLAGSGRVVPLCMKGTWCCPVPNEMIEWQGLHYTNLCSGQCSDPGPGGTGFTLSIAFNILWFLWRRAHLTDYRDSEIGCPHAQDSFRNVLGNLIATIRLSVDKCVFALEKTTSSMTWMKYLENMNSCNQIFNRFIVLMSLLNGH